MRRHFANEADRKAEQLPWWIWSFPIVILYLIAMLWFQFHSSPGATIGCLPVPIGMALIYWRVIVEIQQRRFAERELHQNQRMLSQILNTLPQSIFWKDRNSNYLGCNQTFAKAVGISSAEQIIGKTDFDLPWPRQEAEAYRADDKEVIENQSSKLHIIEPLQQADGTRLLIDTTKIPLIDENGSVFGVLGVYEDITERKITETTLENTRLMLEALIDQSPVPIVVASAPDFVVRYGNRAAREVLGIDDEPSYIGLTMQEVNQRQTWKDYRIDGTVIPPDRLPLIRALHGETVRNEQHIVIRKDGSIRWELVHSAPIYNRDGQLIAGLVIYPDITQQKQAEEALRESNFLFHSLIDRSDIGLAIFSPEKGWTKFNRRLSEMLGYSEEELLSKPWQEMTHPDDLEADIVQFDRILRDEIDNYEKEKRFIHKNGKVIFVHITVTSDRNEDRSLKFVIAALLDITKQKQHEWEIIQEKLFSEKLINTLPGIFYLYDDQMNVVRWNRNLELISGYTGEEIAKKKVLDWFSPQELQEKIHAAIERIKQEGYGSGETFLTIKNGKRIPYLLNGAAIEINGQNFLMGIGVDLEERYRVEEALRQSENRIRSIIESSPMGVHLYELDEEDRLIFTGANPASDRILGVNCGFLIGKPIEEAFPPLQATEIPDRYRLAAREGVPWHSEYISYEDDRIRGAYDTFAFQTSPGRMASFFQDISERKKFELEQKRYFDEIEHLNRLFVGREQQTIELKQKVNDLCMELQKEPPFDLSQIEDTTEPQIPSFPPSRAGASDEDSTFDFDLIDLINSLDLQPLLEFFSEIVGVASAIVDLEGKNIIQSSWQPICIQYHRNNPITCQRCIESDAIHASKLKEGERYSIYQCRNGLIDAASPIVIHGRPVAAVFVGQFLTAPPDEEYFRRQAAEFGFDEQEYLGALRKVPIIPEAKLPAIIGLLTAFSELIAQIGWERIQKKKSEEILAQRAAELNARNYELKQQRAAAISLAEDIEKARATLERSQEDLKKNEERFRSLFDYSPICLWEEDLSQVVAYFNELKTNGVNDIATHLHDHPEAVAHCIKLIRVLDVNLESVRLHQASGKEELIAGLNQTLPPESYEFIKKELIALSKQQQSFEIDSIVRTLNNEVRYVTIRWHVPKGFEETYSRIIVSIIDITERKRAEEEKKALENQLRHSQKMEAVGQLAGGVAHDFNNLLLVINGYTELALANLSPEQKAYKYLKDVGKAGERAARLVSQLLSFSRRQLMKLEYLNLNDEIASLLKMLSRVIGEHIRLNFIPGHELGVICADRGMIDQVIMNLCVNARDAMPNGGVLSIETKNALVDQEYCSTHTESKPGRYVQIGVTDTGCGMDEETRSKIFEPFFTTKEPGQGTGLGLAMVYGIVKQHDGMIQVYSEINKGTLFKIYLPICERRASIGAETVEGPGVGGTETILVAEDDEMVRGLVKQILEDAGYTILMANDGEEALHLFNLHAPQIKLLLLDVVMPKKGGREVYDCVRKIDPLTRVLFASGYSENAIHTNFVLEAGLELIQKPYQRDKLLRIIRRLLDAP